MNSSIYTWCHFQSLITLANFALHVMKDVEGKTWQ
jgi:hypothetical protein